MKEKTSITLSREVLTGIDKIAGQNSRSAVIEAILREHLIAKEKAAIEARDLKILNRAADRLNKEAEEFMSYQADIFDEE